MGNVILLHALDKREMIGEIIGAAPHGDRDEGIAKTITANGGDITLYASRDDLALRCRFGCASGCAPAAKPRTGR